MKKLILLMLILMLAMPASAEPICKVVDGDTFHYCSGKKIRLDSIDTPERGEPFYFQARRALADMLQTRDIQLEGCRLDDTGKRDACRVYADGKDVQAELVRQGMAWDWPRYSGGKYQQLEQEAQTAKRGLWVDGKATAIHWAKRSRFK